MGFIFCCGEWKRDWAFFYMATDKLLQTTLKFINEDAASVHGGIRVSSVFTSESGEWKLGGFDVLSSMKEDDAIIYVSSILTSNRDISRSELVAYKTQTYGSQVPDATRYTPPEVSKGGWEAIKSNPLAAVDAYGLGILVYEVFNGGVMSADQVGKTTNVPPSMHQSYRRLCAANPKLRLSPGNFIEQGKRNGGFFETPLIRLTEDIESLGLKNDAEREEFIKYALINSYRLEI